MILEMIRACWLMLVSAIFPLSSAGPSCRCLSYQPCWPTVAEFSQLQSQLSQPLLNPVPPASACYPPSHPSGNCTDVLSHLDDGDWRSNLPGAIQAVNFESYTFPNGTIDACYYNYTLGFPCKQGSIPIGGVDARRVSDIQAAVKFAGEYNLRLVVKNTGHDYLGRSSARGGFMLWTHNLKNITYNDSFVPEGAPSGPSFKAITLGSGVQWHEAYDAARSNGRIIVGGASVGGSVGAAGGWIQGGGHSALSPKYGLGIDNAIQFTIVLASGEYVTVNQYKYSDLFWAIRGGGGGTFGVVVSVTYQTYDILRVSGAFLQANFSTPQIAQDIITEYIQLHPNLSDAGWGGYASYSQSGMVLFYVGTNVSLAEANTTMTPFFDFVKRTVGNPQDVQFSLQDFASFYDWYAFFISTQSNQVGITRELFSRFLSRTLAEEQPAKVANTTLAVNGGLIFLFVAGGVVQQFSPDSAGINPAWRESVGILLGQITWPEGTPTAQINHLRQGAAANLALLDPLAPNSGTYFNEASLYEKDFKTTFFGSHYLPLKAIKQKYDPVDLFLVAEGVGSDDWDQSLSCPL